MTFPLFNYAKTGYTPSFTFYNMLLLLHIFAFECCLHENRAEGTNKKVFSPFQMWTKARCMKHQTFVISLHFCLFLLDDDVAGCEVTWIPKILVIRHTIRAFFRTRPFANNRCYADISLCNITSHLLHIFYTNVIMILIAYPPPQIAANELEDKNMKLIF